MVKRALAHTAIGGLWLLTSASLSVGAGLACRPLDGASMDHAEASSAPEESPDTPTLSRFDERQRERSEMVREQIVRRGVTDSRVLAAMRRVPRHHFMPRERRAWAYDDRPVSIGHRQTISQPYIVAYMTEALSLDPEARVLEIGTGSGYQAAVLAEVAGEVFTIEIVKPLAEQARERLGSLGYSTIHFRTGDGYVGWPEAAPFDAIMLTAAPPELPAPLLEQLAVGGVLIAPVGRDAQELIVVTRTEEGLSSRSVLGVRFVPMTGRAQGE